MLFAYILAFIVVAGGGLLKYRRTRELSSKLGREVEDYELVSLNSWIEAEEKSEDKRTAFKRKIVDYESKNENRKASPETKKAEKTAPKNAVAAKQLPDNCPNCGAVLSKGAAICNFCGTQPSRELLEQNCAVFLLDAEKDFMRLIPASHSNYRMGCFVIPVLSFFVVFFFGGSFVAPQLRCGASIGAMIVSLVVAFAWNHWTDKILNRRENALFDRAIAPEISRYMARGDWQPLEFLAVAKTHFDENSDFLKQLHRIF